MEELVYKFDEKSTASVLKHESITKVTFEQFYWSHKYIHNI